MTSIKYLIEALGISLILWILIIVGAVTAYGSPYEGHDLLASQSRYFDLKKIIPHYPKYSAFGSLDTTFGNSLTDISKLLYSRHISFYRVHILDYTCVRNRNCDKTYILKRYSQSSLNKAILRKNKTLLSYLAKRARLYCKLTVKYPTLQLAISPFLEHDLSWKAWLIAANTVSKVCPNSLIVNSPYPYKRLSKLNAYMHEIHGNPEGKNYDVISLDGLDISNVNIKKWKSQTKNAYARFYWSTSYNCRKILENKFVYPMQRKHCLSVDDFKTIKRLIR